jgi:hypothetical protein
MANALRAVVSPKPITPSPPGKSYVSVRFGLNFGQSSAGQRLTIRLID